MAWSILNFKKQRGWAFSYKNFLWIIIIIIVIIIII